MFTVYRFQLFDLDWQLRKMAALLRVACSTFHLLTSRRKNPGGHANLHQILWRKMGFNTAVENNLFLLSDIFIRCFTWANFSFS